MAYVAKRAPPNLVLIQCERDPSNGEFYHSVFQGHIRIAQCGFDGIMTDHTELEYFRTHPRESIDKLMELERHEQLQAEWSRTQNGKTPD